MAIPILNINDVPQAIQLALGPAITLRMPAMPVSRKAGRLARIIDRGRHLTEGRAPPEGLAEATRTELQGLDRRRHLASAAIAACTLAALLVCPVIAALFLEVLLDVPLKWLVGIFFTGATLALVVGLAYFLREVHLATTTVRIPARHGPG